MRTLIIFAAFTFWVAFFIGWILNIMNVVHVAMTPVTVNLTGTLLGQVIGIFFAPLGAIMGWLV